MPGDVSVWSATPGSLVRRPRLRFTVNGQSLVGCYEASVSANNRLAADTWEASLAMDADPGFGWAFWGDQKDATIGVEAAFLPEGSPEGSVAGWTSLITGKVDDVHVDPAQGTVHLAGRDLTSLLVDTKIQEAFPNEKTSQILARFAQEHGLKADVTPTTALVGSYYKDEHDKLSLGNFSKQTSEWELACYLVRQEDQDIWIDSQGLHTRPAVEIPGFPQDPGISGAKPFPIIYVLRDGNTPISTANVATDIQCERSLTLAKDVRVTVKSWDAAHKTAYTRTVDGKGSVTAASGNPGISANERGSHGKQATETGGFGRAQTYVFVKPNLTPDQALRFAQQQARVLTMLERVVTVEMPGELELTPRSLVALSGTGTSWDQTYYVDTLTRRISLTEGFRQTVRLKNSSPRTMTNVQ